MIEKLDFQVNSANVTYLKLDQFIEALFVASYSQVLMPSKLQLDDPAVDDLYSRLEKADTRRIVDRRSNHMSQPTIKTGRHNDRRYKADNDDVKDKAVNADMEKASKVENEAKVEKVKVKKEKKEGEQNGKVKDLKGGKEPKGGVIEEKGSRDLKADLKEQKEGELEEEGTKRKMTASMISHGSRVVKQDEGYWEKGIKHLEELLEGLQIPVKRWDTFKLIEDRRKRFTKSQPRYWEGNLKLLQQ